LSESFASNRPNISATFRRDLASVSRKREQNRVGQKKKKKKEKEKEKAKAKDEEEEEEEKRWEKNARGKEHEKTGEQHRRLPRLPSVRQSHRIQSMDESCPVHEWARFKEKPRMEIGRWRKGKKSPA
jgi:hypothetical protein